MRGISCGTLGACHMWKKRFGEGGRNFGWQNGGTDLYEMKIFMDGGERDSDPVGQYVFFHFTLFIIYF